MEETAKTKPRLAPLGQDVTPARVKELRLAMALTQEQLAHLLGVTFSTVNRWESGRSRPNLIARRLLLSLERRHVRGERVDS